MISFRPLTYQIGRLLSRDGGALSAISEKWQIAPSETREVRPVIILPGQAERITRAEFTTLPLLIGSLAGNPAEIVPPTWGYRLTDVDIVDGVLYAHGITIHLRRRRHKYPLGRLEDCGSAALYETWTGNRWFGNWLTDDCVTYRLAEAVGQPVTTTPPPSGHVPRYEELLSMAPRRIGNAHFDELVVFDDQPNNSHRLARAQDLRKRLLRDCPPGDGRNVFLVRGRSGDLRELANEQEIAERLEREYGFRIMMAEDHSVEELATACRTARIVAGVEGSQLNHGIVAMPPGATLLTIQPPDRSTTAMKLLTDRWQQHFAMVICHGDTRSFRAEWEDIARTLDLIDTRTAKEWDVTES